MPIDSASIDVHRLFNSLRWRGIAVNVGGAVAVFVLLAGVDAGDDVPPGRGAELVGVLLAVIVVATTLVSWYLSASWRAVFIDPTGDGSEALLTMPTRTVMAVATAWTFGAAVFGVHSLLRLDNTAGEAGVLVFLVALGGMSAAAASYLVTEHRLRPVYSILFSRTEPQRSRTVALRTRLVLAWLLGSGVPVLFSVAVIADGDLGAAGLRRQALPWLGAALVLGATMTAAVAKGVAASLDGLRGAMSEVRSGRFDVRTTVDDASEIGLLQAGFNTMVAGLEEREQLRDLFGRHVGPEVAQAALAKGASLGGQAVEATAMFIDLIGSTTMVACRDPNEVVALLNDLFDAVVTATEEAGGWVNKFEGDAALCVFGPPADDHAHAARGLHAAVTLRLMLERLRSRHPQLDAAIGISSGTVIAGNVGASRRYEFTVIGDPVNEAARLAELAKTFETRFFASGRVVAAAGREQRAGLRLVGHETLRGRAEPTELWTTSAE